MPDFRMILLHALNVAVLYIILRYLLYKPVKGFMDARQKKIDGQLSAAEGSLQQAKESEAECRAMLENARKEGHTMINDAALHAKENADDIIKMAEEKAREIIKQAREDIEEEKRNLQQELKDQVSDLSVALAAQILHREVRVEDNNEVIRAFFEEKPV